MATSSPTEPSGSHARAPGGQWLALTGLLLSFVPIGLYTLWFYADAQLLPIKYFDQYGWPSILVVGIIACLSAIVVSLRAVTRLHPSFIWTVVTVLAAVVCVIEVLAIVYLTAWFYATCPAGC